MNNFILDEKAVRKRKRKDAIVRNIFAACALFCIVSLGLITFFIVWQGIQPFMPWNANGTVSFAEFVFGTEWSPSEDIYGIGYMIIGTICATIGAIILAVPIALFSAVAVAEVLPNKIANLVRSALEILAGIPSIIYGVFGLGFIVPIIMNVSPESQGQSMLAVILVLAIMILPTVVAVSESAIRSVPHSYKEASLGLGANKIQTIFKVILPAAKSGISAAVVLGVGRAIGETMAVILVAGNPSGGIPNSVFDQIRTMTTNVALEMGYATGLHQQMLFATALMLFIFIIFINIVIGKITKAGESEHA